jgi:hypothetical protein
MILLSIRGFGISGRNTLKEKDSHEERVTIELFKHEDPLSQRDFF